jgi:hypothetical protein
MATLFEVLKNVREDIIVDRVATVEPATSSIDEKFRAWGDPQENDDFAGRLEDHEGPPWRLFDVSFESPVTAGIGATTQPYDLPINIIVTYPRTEDGRNAAWSDAQQIWCNLRNGSGFPTGLEAYFPSEGESELEEKDDSYLLNIPVSARINADC